eukprot:scaffold1399_cov410-Prasinococcus_capsulatus_cf.AAC.5
MARPYISPHILKNTWRFSRCDSASPPPRGNASSSTAAAGMLVARLLFALEGDAFATSYFLLILVRFGAVLFPCGRGGGGGAGCHGRRHSPHSQRQRAPQRAASSRTARAPALTRRSCAPGGPARPSASATPPPSAPLFPHDGADEDDDGDGGGGDDARTTGAGAAAAKSGLAAAGVTARVRPARSETEGRSG